MAEALVFLVIKKISSILTEEPIKALASQLGKQISIMIEAESSIKQIRSEFEVMQAFLSRAERQDTNNKARDAWVEQVRGIAYDVEDTIDEYAYLIGGHHIGFWGSLNKYYNKSINIIDWHNLATRLKQIESRLRNISEMKYRYSIKMTRDSSSSNYLGGRQRNLAGYSYLLDQDDLVGIEDERKKLIQWLTEERPARFTIAVWGMGGLGKTCLVRNVYNSMEIKRHFNNHAWISVSQKYEVQDLLRRIILEFSVTTDSLPPSIDTMDHAELFEFLRWKLQEKRYLIILDDIWSRDAWFAIAGAFEDNNSGSRVVVTTRIKNVAGLAIGGRVIKLESLHEMESWDLFCRRAFCHEQGKRCPLVLERWGKLITEKCKGLPLAIVAIGSLLSYSIMEEEKWRKFYERLSWELNNNMELNWVANILNLSYNELPKYLKNCFLYCSLFPEDYLIKRKRVIRLWIAEGFIDVRGTQTLEEVAEDYLNELIHRSMLQVVVRNDSGRVKRCQMHDLTRDLTLSVSHKENFCVVCENPKSALLYEEARRLTVHDISEGVQSSSKFPHLRSFIVSGIALSSHSLISAVACSSRFLRVLDLQNVPIEKLPDEVVNLFNLQHLGLRKTNVKELPRNLERLRNLQTLDLWYSKIEKLPRGVTKLTKLRHLFAERLNDPTRRAFHALGSVPAPKGLCNLRGLQTLCYVEASRGLVATLWMLTQLRSLRITKVRCLHCAALWATIVKLRFLSHLQICAKDEKEVLRLEGFNPQNRLQKLYLQGRLDQGVLPAQFFLELGKSLRWLALSWSGLQADPLPSLSCLSNLEVLTLINSFSGRQLWFRAGWFPNLIRLQLFDLRHLNWVGIEKGAMESLHYLELVGLRELKSVPQGIEFLKSLQELYLGEMLAELKECLQEKERCKVEHIPIVDYGGLIHAGPMVGKS